MKMGETKVTVRIHGPKRSSDVELFVDTGATFTKIQRSLAEAIGLVPNRTVELELADGRRVERPIARAEIEYEGVAVPVQVVLGSDDEEPLMGLTALENLGLKVDPLHQRLEPSTFKEYQVN